MKEFFARGDHRTTLVDSTNTAVGCVDQDQRGTGSVYGYGWGITWDYEIAAMDILGACDVEDMTAGEYDLTLFTCTKDRQHRVTVRCNMIQE